MRVILLSVLICVNLSLALADSIVLPYQSFGPQVVAHELIGKERWQWEKQVDSDVGDAKRTILVVVYWNENLADIQKKFPVNAENLKDYRYVELAQAVTHLKKVLDDASDAQELDVTAVKSTLTMLLNQVPTNNANGHANGE